MGGVCFLCSKKLSLVEETVNKCKCAHVFCKKHKDAETHTCSYNYFGENSNLLKTNMPIINCIKVIAF